MHGPDPEDLLYYITLYNEAFAQPAMPDGVEEGILAGLYRYQEAPTERTHRARILASGTAMLAALEAQQMLFDRHDVAAEVWSATSYKALRDEALAVERRNRLHPGDPRSVPYVERVMERGEGPVVAVTDFVKLVPDQVARWMPAPFLSLGTDGFGLSDTRPALRRHFETDAAHIVVAVLSGLSRSGDLGVEAVTDAVRRYEIDPEVLDPWAA
jgi:pyruvate dehydrogenase E1 component